MSREAWNDILGTALVLVLLTVCCALLMCF